MGRIRSNSNALSLISKSNYLIKEIKPNFFNNKKQLHLEIGMGKGDFIIQSAIQYPNINFIGIERDNTIVLKAINKLNKLERKIDNLLIININANDLQKWFNEQSIDKIYLNFSDPWPKKRHEKYRLTSLSFLKIYQWLLKTKGMIELKTDNDSFYKYSLESVHKSKIFKITYQTNNIYKDKSKIINNIQSEYEKKFIKLNKNINKIELSN